MNWVVVCHRCTSSMAPGTSERSPARRRLVRLLCQSDQCVRHELGRCLVAGKHQLGVAGDDLGLAHLDLGEGSGDHLPDEVVGRTAPPVSHPRCDVPIEFFGRLLACQHGGHQRLSRVEGALGDGSHGIAPSTELGEHHRFDTEHAGDDQGRNAPGELGYSSEDLTGAQPLHEDVKLIGHHRLDQPSLGFEVPSLDIRSPDAAHQIVSLQLVDRLHGRAAEEIDEGLAGSLGEVAAVPRGCATHGGWKSPSSGRAARCRQWARRVGSLKRQGTGPG